MTICLRLRGEGERDFIDSTINYKLFLGDFRGIHKGIQFMRVLTLFIARDSQGFTKPQLDPTPNQKRSPNLNRRAGLPVGRWAGRPTLSYGRPVGRPGQTKTKECQLVDRSGRPFSLPRSTGRSTGLRLCLSLIHI